MEIEIPIDAIRHSCGNEMKFKMTKGFMPRAKLYCENCKMFPQFHSMYIAYDWRKIGAVMEYIIEQARRKFKLEAQRDA